MNQNTNFKVLQSNPNQSGGFVTKLQRTTFDDDPIFGQKKKTETYYISGSKEVEKDTEIPATAIFPKYRVEEREGVNPGTGESIMMKWLHLK